MRKKITHAVRLKTEVLDEIDHVCDINCINRSSFVNLALRHYLITMAKAGLIEPLDKDAILEESAAFSAETERLKQESMAHPKNNEEPRRRGRTKKPQIPNNTPLEKPKPQFYPREHEPDDLGLAAAEEDE